MTWLESVEDDGRKLTLERSKRGSVSLAFGSLARVVQATRVIRVPHLGQRNDMEDAVELTVAAAVHTQSLMSTARAGYRRRSAAHRKGGGTSAVSQVAGMTDQSGRADRGDPFEREELRGEPLHERA
jgi:hypothetical protein